MGFYFNNDFKVAYSMWHFFTVTLLIPYCLLAFNVSFFCDIIFNVVLSDAFMWKCLYSFLDNSLLYVTLIKDSISLSSPKEFLYQLVPLVPNW